ncbi:molybdopterin cofactor-binding domain-containing protein [Aquabacterium sp. J223]|uniref:xanthine dehydrogenase family protein molybdopterin-binding subunit n=1 Tax=Aquabacterium sp. J223 TaxID=2898431 RepID=UPI0021AE109F|nr:molybdopterin cofactor-binding domain-containing protein [Aquabacterium sp. J223]UUX95648.1 molybdopterin-dependent oxidoreductase [Aquabacterium sp. J223]
MRTEAQGISLQRPSRRQFLLTTGGLSIGVAFGVPAVAQNAPASAAGAGAEAFGPNAWVTIGTDGTVTIVSPAAEMGQGTSTAMPMCLAEDLDADWSKVVVKQAPHNPKAYGNRLFGGAMATGASRTTRGYYQPMRLAGAQARLVLLQAAAGRWNVPVGELTTEPGVVVHAASGRRMGYGEVASFATVPAELPTVTPAQLKPLKDCRLIGRDIARLDMKDKVTGRAMYGIDTRLPGMLHGAVLRAPQQKDRPQAVDDSAARQVKGWLATVQLPYGVGVLATNTWAARKARDALKVTWAGASPAKGYTTAAVKRDYQAVAADLGRTGVEVERHGDVPAAIAGASRVLKADYVTGHLAHVALEPMNATAQWNGDRLEVWAPTQAPTIAAATLAGALQMPMPNIVVHTTLLGGGFGRRVEGDYTVDAALLAKAADGKPVKVTWSREDDVRNDKLRPLVAQHLEAGLDGSGKVVALRHRVVSESIYGRTNPAGYKAAGGKDAPVHEGAEHLYGIDAHLVEFLRQERGIDVGFWRGVGGGYTKFALESMIDEVAIARKMDPLALRLELLAKQPRAQAVLREAAAMAGWDRPRPRGRALGIAYSDIWETHIAEVAEVSVDRKTGELKVHGLWAAVDAGVALLPTSVARQVEGGMLWGLETLRAELTHTDGVVQQSNFHDYPVLRLADVPPVVQVKVLRTEHSPGGVGEAGLPPLAPAVANAFAKLTGKRLRSLPFSPETVKRALA